MNEVNKNSDSAVIEEKIKTENKSSVTNKNNTKKNSKSSAGSSAQYALKLFIFLLILVLVFITFFTFFFYTAKNNFKFSNLFNLSSQSLQLTRSETNTSQASFGALQFAENSDTKTPAKVFSDTLNSVVSIRLKIETANSVSGLGSESAGTGFFATSDGLIVTNRHVVAAACNINDNETGILSSNSISLTALTSQNKAYELEILTIDPIDDLAILKVKDTNNEKFQPVSFADSKKLSIGSDVLAIGNVLGEFSNSATKGIISGLNRTLKTDLKDECTSRQVVGEGLIQTDAAINQGNSGGPLFDASGNVIGVNTFGATSAQNIGFALPSETIIQSINSYKESGKILKPQLGVVTRTLDPALKVQYPWLPTDYGELVYSPNGSAVLSGTGAQKAGISDGDIILEIDGVKIISDINGNSPFRKMILDKKPNSDIKLTVLKSTSKATSNGFVYAKSTTELTVKLGSIGFDFNKNLTSIR